MSITNVYTHAKKSEVETESTVDIKTLVYTAFYLNTSSLG